MCRQPPNSDVAETGKVQASSRADGGKGSASPEPGREAAARELRDEVVWRMYGSGFTHRQIGQAFGVTDRTSKNWVARIKARSRWPLRTRRARLWRLLAGPPLVLLTPDDIGSRAWGPGGRRLHRKRRLRSDAAASCAFLTDYGNGRHAIRRRRSS